MSLADRVKKILLQPKQEWPVIDAEATSVGDLYRGYIVPLAAIGPAAGIIGWSVFGVRVPFVGTTYRVPLGSAIASGIVQYVLALVGVFVLALIIDALAPSFSGQKSQIQALKVAAYSSTAAWLAGVFALVPALAILAILGLYSLYLLYLGLPVLMKAPQEKALGYTVVVVIAGIVLFFVIGWASRLFVRGPGLPELGM
jgi:sterol desaturase/sphingolipid hydroxylase (fatty acid hydroxylase superfamily)